VRAIALALALVACAPITTEISSVRFAPVIQPQGVARSNADLAEDFLDLTFELESGETLEGLLRYEAPVRIYVRSAALAPYRRISRPFSNACGARRDWTSPRPSDPRRRRSTSRPCPPRSSPRLSHRRLLHRARRDQLGRLPAPPGRGPPALVGPAAARRRRDLPARRHHAAGRARLHHEEITQALGPANDLYRLPDSIWNDDNFHGIATPFDMLMLRTLYQPEFRSGMTRPEAAAVLPRVLNRVNPRGRGLPRQRRHPESRAWANAIEVALARGVSPQERLGAARVAAEIALEMRPVDHRLEVSLLTLGRLTIRRDPATAARHFAEAYNLSRRRFGDDDVRTAQAGVHVAALAVSTGQPEVALTIAERHLDAARRAQNAILLAGLLSIRAESLLELDREDEARAARLDSLRWARYGFGDADGAFAREQAQIDALLRLDEE
jgi:hypothetical protein